MDGNAPNTTPAENETVVEQGTPQAPALTRESQVMATPPPADLPARSAEVGAERVITARNAADLATPAPGTAPAPRINSRQFAAQPAGIPNEFRITHEGKDLGGKTLTPTEVPVVLGWLNSLPADE